MVMNECRSLSGNGMRVFHWEYQIDLERPRKHHFWPHSRVIKMCMLVHSIKRTFRILLVLFVVLIENPIHDQITLLTKHNIALL